jgi:hypothetical protein
MEIYDDENEQIDENFVNFTNILNDKIKKLE